MIGIIRRPVSAVFALPLLVGCYSLAPLETPMPSPDTRIVATVTDSGAAALSNSIGPGATEIEGIVSEADGAQWKIRLLRVDTRFGGTSAWDREVVTFPRFALMQPRVKVLDRRKSFLAGGGIVLGAFLAARLFSGLAADEPPGGGPVPPAIRLVPGGS